MPDGLLPSATPAGTTTTAATNDQSHTNGLSITVATDNNLNLDFALRLPPVDIGNRIWYENDGDGDASNGSPTPASGLVVTATASDGSVYTATTDVNGQYTLTVPANATYTVTVGTPDGYDRQACQAIHQTMKIMARVWLLQLVKQTTQR